MTDGRRSWRPAQYAVALLCGLGLALAGPGAARAATELAITLDDLPTHGLLPRGTTRLGVATTTIETLRTHAAPGVYGFVNGGQIGGDPELEAILRAWRDAGLLLGNHTFSHLDLARASAEEYIADIERNETVLARLDPAPATRYFRYPYLSLGDVGAKHDAVRRWLTAHGYTVAPVTVSFEDWAWNEPYVRCAAIDDGEGIARLKAMFVDTALAHLAWSEAEARRLFGRPIKQVLVLHMGAFEALVLDDVLRAYERAGVTLIGLDAAMRDPVYGSAMDAAAHGKRTFLGQAAEGARVTLAPDPPSRLPELDRVCR